MMKTLLLISTILILASSHLFAKKNAVEIIETSYAIGISHVNSGSGQGAGYTLNGGVIKGRKSLEVGIIYSENESRIAGGDFKYRVFLGNIYRVQDKNTVYTPYLQYNLMYQKGTSNAPDIIQLGEETYELPSEPGIVTTMGHYLSLGNKVRIFDRAYFDTSLGLGVYQGSLDHINGPDTWGIHKANHGFTFALKVGIGYTFN